MVKVDCDTLRVYKGSGSYAFNLYGDDDQNHMSLNFPKLISDISTAGKNMLPIKAFISPKYHGLDIYEEGAIALVCELIIKNSELEDKVNNH